jgi:hypothetical protein
MKKWLFSVPSGLQSPALVDLILHDDLVIVANIDPTNVLDDGGLDHLGSFATVRSNISDSSFEVNDGIDKWLDVCMLKWP